VRHELQKLTQNALKNGITVNFSPSLEDFILNCITDKSFGARSIKRTVQNKVTDILSLKFIKNPAVKEYSISVTKNKDEIDVKF
jgi:ATP-dependent Clp protease ATP-binding subunit ClpA